MRLSPARFNLGRLMLAIALVGVAIVFLKSVVDLANALLVGRNSSEEVAWALILLTSGLFHFRREGEAPSEPALGWGE